MSSSSKNFNILTHSFTTPIKTIKTEPDVRKFTRSTAYMRYKFFITDLAEACISQHYESTCIASAGDKENSFNEHFNQDFIKIVSESDPTLLDDEISNFTLLKLDSMLNRVFELIDETPCINDDETIHRFGNKAYRDFYDKFVQENRAFVSEIYYKVVEKAAHNVENTENSLSQTDIKTKVDSICDELTTYLNDSIGNRMRIDYGTGHEAAFLTFLCCFFATNAISSTKKIYKILTVNKIFRKYLKLCRKIQITYRLEPAGSKGNYGMDDFQFCCYIFGSAQLRENSENILPEDYTIADRCARYKNKYMLFEAVDFIHNVKSGPFAEHSNQLWNISSVTLWEKMHQGMIKKYAAEVLSKLPIMQHFYFGSIFPKP